MVFSLCLVGLGYRWIGDIGGSVDRWIGGSVDRWIGDIGDIGLEQRRTYP
jgi:hypothetical protein